MSKKNNKPTLDESEYFDEIQAQVTELMGPPPLRTTPSSENLKNDPKLVNNNVINESDKNDVSDSVDVAEDKVPESTVPKPPTELESPSTEADKVESEIEPKTLPPREVKKKKVQPEEQDIVSDKSITIEEAEKLSKKFEDKSDEKIIENADSIYSSKVSTAVEDIESREHPVKNEKNITTSKKIHKTKIPKKKIFIIILLLIFLALITVFLIPKTRYEILNTIGIRSSLSFSVVDAKTNFPITDAAVNIQGSKFTTDENGKFSATNLELGPTSVIIKKRSFNDVSQVITIGWGSNPINKPFSMNPSGNVYSIQITDWMTNKAVEGVAVISADSRVKTNKNGLAEISIAENAPKSIKIQSDEYREESISLDNQKETKISLVPATPNYFIVEKEGKYNLVKKDLDGNNEITIFGGTGSESLESISILPKPSGGEQVVAFVSTRTGQKNADGYLLSDLYIVQANKKNANKVEGAQSEKIELIGWDESRLIFKKTISGPSASKDDRDRILSYDAISDNTIELAKSNNFVDQLFRKNVLYYAGTGSGAKLFSIRTDGSDLRTILNKEVWAIEEVSDSVFAVNTSDKKWQKINFNNNNIEEITSLQNDSNINSIKLYSPSGQKLAMLDTGIKSGKLIIKNVNSKITEYNSPLVKNQQNLVWINDNYLLLKTSSPEDSSAVIININSAEPKVTQ
jgi:hypothetical protein